MTGALRQTARGVACLFTAVNRSLETSDARWKPGRSLFGDGTVMKLGAGRSVSPRPDRRSTGPLAGRQKVSAGSASFLSAQIATKGRLSVLALR